MEDITDIDYRHSKEVFKEFKINNLGDFMIYMSKAIHYYLLM